MAKLVLAAGVPHPPRLVYEMTQSPGKMRGEALMKQVREQVEKAEPDLIIEVDSDHFVNFFYNNLPSFCVGMAEEAEGPQETWCPIPRYTVRGHVPLAKALFRYSVNAKFDLAAAHGTPRNSHLHQRLRFTVTSGDALFCLGPHAAPVHRSVGRQGAYRPDRQRLLRDGRRRTAQRLD